MKTRHAERPLTNVIDWDSGGLLTLAATAISARSSSCCWSSDSILTNACGGARGRTLRIRRDIHCGTAPRPARRTLPNCCCERGASPNVHVDSSGSPVYAAYSHRQRAMVDLLKRYGGVVTPDIVGLYRETALAEDLLAGRTVVPDGTVPHGRSLEDYLLEYALSGGAAEIVRLGARADRLAA